MGGYCCWTAVDDRRLDELAGRFTGGVTGVPGIDPGPDPAD